MAKEYKCPVCQIPCKIQTGTELNRLDGISMECSNKECPNTANGHGKNEKEAYQIILEKVDKSTGK